MEGLQDRGEMHVGAGRLLRRRAPLRRPTPTSPSCWTGARWRPAGGDLEAFYRPTLRALAAGAPSGWPARVPRGPPRAIGPLALEARRVSAPGALLVGDAAGFYDPFTGEGVTLALRERGAGRGGRGPRLAQRRASTTSRSTTGRATRPPATSSGSTGCSSRSWPGRPWRTRGAAGWRAARTSPTAWWASPGTSCPRAADRGSRPRCCSLAEAISLPRPERSLN